MEKRTDVVVVLDRSGSMESRKADHEGGLRSFVEDQRSIEGDVRLTLIQFDTENPCEVLFDAVPMKDVDVSKIRLVPRGGTPLLDAMLKAASHAESKIPAESNTILMTITDGGENSSREATTANVKDRIESLQAKGWVCLFLGAGIDAFHEAAGTGVRMHTTASTANTGTGIHNTYSNLSGKVFEARSAGVCGQSLNSVDFAYSEEERADLVGEVKTSGFQEKSKHKFLRAVQMQKAKAKKEADGT